LKAYSRYAGITISPDGNKAYVTDTGIALGFYGRNLSSPASVYSFDVAKDGTFGNRKTFAYVPSGIPDGLLHLSIHQTSDPLTMMIGVHTDSKGRIYTGAGDGVWVYNTSGKLIGKIYTGTTAANFQFTGKGRMIITGQTKLFYATVAASGAPIQ
jgi:gluconolactonase